MSENAYFLHTAGSDNKAVWLSILVGAFLFVLVGVLWWTLDHREQTNLYKKNKADAEYLATYIDADLRNRIPALQRMVKRWEMRGGLPKEEFISEARLYLSDVPGFQALEWVDKEFIVRWVVPLEGNERAQNLNLAFEQKRRIALEKAKNIRSLTATEPIDLVQGGKGFLVYFPIYVQGDFEGFILAVFRIHEWLEYVFKINEHHTADDFRISVFFDGVLVFKQAGWDELEKIGFSAVSETNVLEYRLVLDVRPTQACIERGKTLLPELAAMFGTLLSVLVSFIIYLLQKAKRSKEELQHALSRLDLATKAGGIGVWTWDMSTDILIWNERMYDLYDIPPDVTLTYETWRTAVHPDDLLVAEPLLRNAVQGKAEFNTEFRIILTGGAVRYLGAAAKVERNHTGKPQRVTGITWDMTARKEAEETLKKSEEQVRLLLNSTEEAIYGIDLKGNCTFANPSCSRMLGYADPEMLLGKNMHLLIHHSYPDGTQMAVEDCRIYRAFLMGRGDHVEDEVLWKADGTCFPVEYWSYPEIVSGEVCGAVVTFNDITERKRAEKLLETERQRLSYILEGTNVGTWEWNVQTGETIFNERWAEMIGFTLAELSPVCIDTWMKCTHPDDIEVSRELLNKHFNKELEYYECEARMRHKNGSWVWVLERGKVATWTDDGKPLVMSGTHQDITARKRIEEEIRRQGALLASLLDSIPDIIFFKDIAGAYMGCNPAFAEFVGRSRNEIIGRTDYDLFERGVADFFREHDQKMMSVGDPRHNEEWITYPDGRRVLLDTLKTPYKGPDGELLGVLGISRDITDRKHIEETLTMHMEELARINNDLHREKEQTELILNDVGDGVAVIDMQGRIVMINIVAKNLLGVTETIFEGNMVDGLFVNCALTDKQQQIIHSLIPPESFSTIVTLETPLELDIKCTILHDENGNNAGQVYVFHDVTRIREIDRMKSNFVSSVSHELRTPLTSIKGFTTTILHDPQMPEQTRLNFLSIIDKEADRLTSLIEDILEISRIETGKVAMRTRLYTLDEVVGKIYPSIKKLADDKQLQLDCIIQEGLPALTGDIDKMSSVFTNFLANAVKFTPAGGRIDFTVFQKDEYVVAEISDTGFGIPEKDIPLIFERFYRVHRPGTQIPGTGLGLAICRELVHLHGGHIEVKSTLNKGTVFSVYLPITVKTAETAA